MAANNPICMRNTLLYQALMGKANLRPRGSVEEIGLKKDVLIDALMVLYNEFCQEAVRDSHNAKKFIGKYEQLVEELRKLRVNVSDFDVKKIIGRGHFGEVHLVQEKKTGDIYAMKVMKKDDILARPNVAFYEEERNIMTQASSDWITSLHYAFQDDNNLYLVMDYHPGGNLFSLMERHSGGFTEDMARFYIAETILAVHSLHSTGYVHRDIKPENILLDRLGHVKLADFGSAAKLSSSAKVESEMPVGTPDYIAPEVLTSLDSNSNSYGGECDYWSIGILAYEMVFGETPFAAENTTTVYAKIMNSGTFSFPQDTSVSPEFQDLVVGLLRESSRRMTYADLIEHPFFTSVNWADLRNQVPPYVPSLNGLEDTSNFSVLPCKKPADLLRTDRGNRRGMNGKDLPFVGFTFVRGNAPSFEMPSDISKELEKRSREIRDLERKIQNYEKEKAGLKQQDNLRQKVALLQQKLLEERKIAAQKTYECTAYKNIIEKERKDRIEMEQKTVEMVRSITDKWQKKLEDQEKVLQETDLSARQLLMEKNTLDEDIQSLKREMDNFQKKNSALAKKLIKYKDMALRSQQVHDRRASFAMGPNEVRLREQVASLEEQCSEAEQAKAVLQQTVKKVEDELKQLKRKHEADLRETERSFAEKEASFQKRSKELQDKVVREKELRLRELEQLLEREKSEAVQLRIQIKALSKSLDDSLQQKNQNETSFSAKESELETKIKQMEGEMRQAVQNKLELQRQLLENERREKESVQACEMLHRQLQEALEKVENIQQEMNARPQAQSSQEAKADSAEKVEYMENQIKKLEENLEKTRESLTLEREKSRQVQLDLWKKEKELSNAAIDLRIAVREKKDAENEITKLQLSENQLKESLQAKQEEISQLKKEIDRLKASLDDLNTNLVTKEAEVTKKCEEINEARKAAAAADDFRREKSRLETELKLLEQQKKVTESELKLRQEEIEQHKLQVVDMRKEADKWKSKHAELEASHNELRSACAIMDEQLEEFQQLIYSYERKESSIDDERKELQQRIEQLQADLRSAKQQVNEEKSLKAFAESKLKDAESRLKKNQDSSEGYIEELKKQLHEATNRASELLQQVTELNKQLTDSEMALTSTARRVSDLENENADLKEETSALMTQLVTFRNSNSNLSSGLEQAISKGEAYKTKMHELEAELERLRSFYKEREYKSESMSAQQLKLIEHLQSKAEEKDKKKKTLADKLFGNKKENQTPMRLPATPLPRRADPTAVGETPRSGITREAEPRVPLAQKELAHLTQSPGAQGSPASASSLAVQRMRHNIPHRLQQYMVMRATNCAVCLDTIHFGRYASFCQECGITAHPKCASHLPSTCGLPHGLAKHFGAVLDKGKTSDSADVDDSEAHSQMGGWVKVPQPGKACWERKYLKLLGSQLCVYDHEPSQGMEPIDKLELQPKDSSIVTIHAAVSHSEVGHTAKCDLPYIFMVEVAPLTTCWPGRTLLVMAPDFAKKKAWIAALEAVSKSNVQRPPSASVVLKMPKDRMDVNCAQELDGKLLLGAAEGLFVLHRNNGSLVQIEGVQHVQQISLVPTLGLAFLIVGLEQKLVSTDLNVLKRLADSAQCSKPTLVTEPVENVESCHLFAVQARDIESAYLCAATQDRVKFFKWSRTSTSFVLRKELNGSETCSCIWFTRNSVIIGCDRFYEVDLLDFTAEEFLDASDQSLSHVVFGLSKLRSFPVAILEVTQRQGQEEYLLCYHEFGIFVDAYGRRSRPSDIKWSRLPLAFAYQAPYLFVIHFNSVEIMLLTGESFTHKGDSSLQASAENLARLQHEASTFVELAAPRYLGAAGPAHDGSIYIYTGKQNDDVEIVQLDGKLFLRGNFTADAETCSISGSESDVSITSSLIEAANNLSRVSSSTSNRLQAKRSPSKQDGANKRVKFESAL